MLAQRVSAPVKTNVLPAKWSETGADSSPSASSSLFFEVFRKHDSGNLLLTQAEREVLEQELELTRLRETLEELHARRVAYREVKRATPFGFPLMVARFREKVSTEKLNERVARMVRELEKAADV